MLLGQINDPVASVVADGAYDALVVYGAAQAKGERQAVRVLMPAGQAFLRWESRADEPGLGPGESLRTSVLGRARPHKGGTLRTETGRNTQLYPRPSAALKERNRNLRRPTTIHCDHRKGYSKTSCCDPTSDIAPPRSRAAPRSWPSRRDPLWCARSSRRDGRPGPRG